MKRLANCFYQLIIVIFVSTLVLRRGSDIGNINLLLSSTSASPSKQTQPIFFALAQEYSTIEERIYIAESFIDQDGREKGSEYARVESYTIPPNILLQQQQQHLGLQQQAQQAVGEQQAKGDHHAPYQQVQPLQSDTQHQEYLPVASIPPSTPQANAAAVIGQQNHEEARQQTLDTYGSIEIGQIAQPALGGHTEIFDHTYHHSQKQLQRNPSNPQVVSQSSHHQSHNIMSHHEEAISPGWQYQQRNQQSSADGNTHQVPTDSMAPKNQPQLLNGRQYRYAHTKIEWRRESSDEGEMSEFFMHNHHETAASSYPIGQDQLTYVHYHQQQQQTHHQNDHQHIKLDQSQQQQINHYQFPHHHHQQQIPTNPHLIHHEQHQQFIYARHISDEHDYEAAQQYYYNSRPIVASHHNNPSSCDSVDDSSILILPSEFEQSTCRAASTLDNSDDPNVAAAHATDSFNAHRPSRNSNVESFPLALQHYHYESSLMSAIRHYWREVSGLCLASAIFLNWLFVVVKRKFIAASGLATVRAESLDEQLIPQNPTASLSATTTKSVSKDTNITNSAHDSAFEENVSPMSLDDVDSSSSAQSSCQSLNDKSAISLKPQAKQRGSSPVMRQRSSTLRAGVACCPSSGHASLSQSTSLSTSVSNTSEYTSRYSSDFDSIQRLGRGGFGIVFEARNKIDDCHYAVKRICLPLEKEARERVMREVRALAKLDHAGIVRYYNAWLETPPDDWLRQHDAQLGIFNSRDGMSFPSTDGIYERAESELNPKGGNTGQLGESGDYSSDWFGTNKKGSNLRRRRTNGYQGQFLRNNSSSPSLDIVFEGSGSIRLEAENSTKQTNSNNNSKLKSKNKKNVSCDINTSDSEDSDFIQFKSRGNDSQNNALVDRDDVSSDDESSISANNLTEQFSTSSSGDGEGVKIVGSTKNKRNNGENGDLQLATTPVGESRKKALNYQKEMRQLQNGENNINSGLHLEKVYLYIQMQLCRKDTLKDWLRTNCDNRDKTTIFDLFYQIVDAVEYVHSQDLIHRDLKPSNIFFSLDGTLKIGDFGLCRAKTNAGVGSSLDLQEYVAESEVERSFDAVHTEQVGTQLYMSPEQLNGLSYNQKVDIFAMGLILLELMIPFKTQMQRVNVLFKARNNLYSEEFKKDNPQEYELVKSLLSRSPQKRPTACEIKQHELLANAQLSQPVIERIYHRRRTISSNSSTE